MIINFKKIFSKILWHKNVIMLGIIFVLSLLVSSVSIKETYTHNFYQSVFYPALDIACNGNAAAIGLNRNDKVIEFIETRVNKIECADVPYDIAKWPMGLQQTSQDYLIKTLGLVWKFTGIDWGVMIYINSLMFVISMVLAFYIFNYLGLSQYFSFFATLWLIFSVQGLDFLPNYREYGKVPFVYASLLFALIFLLKKQNIRDYLILSAVSGVVIGLGIGFRADLIVFIPLVLVAIVIKKDSLDINFKWRLFAVLIFFLCFLLFGLRIINALSNGNLYHVILLGLMESFDAELGVYSGLYQFGNFYNDIYIEHVVNAYNSTLGNIGYSKIEEFNYSGITLQYLIKLVQNFPADFVLRFISSVVAILSLAYNSVKMSGVIGLISLAIITINLIAIKQWRIIIIGYIILLYICGFAFLQFMPRHYFHIQIVSIVLLIGSIQVLVKWKYESGLVKIINVKSILSTSCFFVFPFIVVGLLRYYQDNQLNNLMKVYLVAATDSIEPTVTSNGDFSRYEFKMNFSDDEHFKYVKIDIGKCDNDSRVEINYETGADYLNFSRSIEVPNSLGNSVNFFPIFNVVEKGSQTKISSIVVENISKCNLSLSIFKDNKLEIIPMNFNLYGDWRSGLFHQSFNYNSLIVKKNSRDIFYVPKISLVLKKWDPKQVVPLIKAPTWMILKD